MMLTLLLASSAVAQPCRVPYELVNLQLHLHALTVARQFCGKEELDVQAAINETVEAGIQAAINLRGPGSEAHFRSPLSRFIQSQRSILGERLAFSPEGCREDPMIQQGRSETLAVIETIREGLSRATSPGGPWSQLQCGPD